MEHWRGITNAGYSLYGKIPAYGVVAVSTSELTASESCPLLRTASLSMHSVETFLENKISDESKRKLLWDNCARYYGIQS